MSRLAFYFITGFLTFMLGVASIGVWHKEPVKIGETVPYKVLEDDMGATISIGVQADVDEGQLRATLMKAATEHQDDAARDYLIADHLWVDAYLIVGAKQSSAPAGRIGRYVPPRNPDAKDEDLFTEKEDQFFITLKSALDTLK
jgi:hypothetical protein